MDQWLRALAESAYAVVCGSAVVGLVLGAGVIALPLIGRKVTRRDGRGRE